MTTPDPTPDPLVAEMVTGQDVLGGIHRTLDCAWERHRHVPAAIPMTVATGAAEIGAIIIQHAGADRPVPVRMCVVPHQVRVVFTDDGDPAPVDLDSVSLPGVSATHGRGLALASSVLAELSYHRLGTRNQWTLVSRRF